jgi:hypothetical protein
MSPRVDDELRTYNQEVFRILNISLTAEADQTGKSKGATGKETIPDTSERGMKRVLTSLKRLTQDVKLDGIPK